MNLTILDVVKKEVTKLLAVGIIYPISDSQWVSLVQVVPKKLGMIVIRNQHNELVPMRIQNSWQATRKDHFPLPFIDQVLEKLVGKFHYCFLDGFFRYMQIHIAPEDKHKTTFTCLFGTFAYTRMPFGMCNAPSTFQCCMTSIFSDLLHECMEVFMDNFTVYADSFDTCLENLSKVLTRCIDTNLVLNFEKCHFMVTEGIVLGHLVSNKGIEVDKSKIDIITSLPNPTSVQDVRSFLGHVGFNRRFIKNFNKTILPLSKLLQKDELKSRLTSAPILQAPNWEFPFELVCDASNSTLGAVLGQRVGVGKPVHVIAYASRTMDPAQLNYTTTKKELLAIIDKKGVENSVADHLSRIEKEADPMPIKDEFPNEQLLYIITPTPWFADICNFFPLEASRLYKERLQNDAKNYIWDDPYLWKLCNNQVIRKCIPNTEINSFLIADSIGPPFSRIPINSSPKCQKVGMTISRRHEMPQQPIMFYEVFDVWGIDFMGPFLVSDGYSYILLAVDYVSRWVEAIVTKTYDDEVVVDFLKSNIFYQFGVPKALISDQGSHFYNKAMSSLLHKYRVVDRIAIAYHPQTNGQAEVFNREIKKTLQKMTNPSRKDWS
ncbi:Retrovirus-related Pol polyprotein, partial [Mucuna pruriens]